MEKHLRHYAEPEIAALDGLVDHEPWANVLVIPACNETAEFLRPPPACGGRSLLVLVINEPVSAPPEVSSSNKALLATVQERFESLWRQYRRPGGDRKNTRALGSTTDFSSNWLVAREPCPTNNRFVRLKETTQHRYKAGCHPGRKRWLTP